MRTDSLAGVFTACVTLVRACFDDYSLFGMLFPNSDAQALCSLICYNFCNVCSNVVLVQCYYSFCLRCAVQFRINAARYRFFFRKIKAPEIVFKISKL